MFILWFFVTVAAIGSEIYAQFPLIKSVKIGGVPAKLGDAPYQVNIKVDDLHYCSGSLISACHVLTTGYCSTMMSTKLRPTAVAVAGTISSKTGGQIRKIQNMIVHPQFSIDGNDFDIAILKLDKPFVLGRNIQIIPLCTKGVSVGSNAVFSGWGDLLDTGNIPEFQQLSTFRIISNKECETYAPIKISQFLFCAAPVSKDHCQGDPGGIMAHNGCMLGIVASGNGCPEHIFPNAGSYTNITRLVTWIQANMK